MVGGKRLSAALAALLFSAAAFAQDSGSHDRHLYVGGGAGQAVWRPGCGATVPDCDDTNISVHAFAGYQWNSWLAGEIAFTNYGMADGTNFEVKGRGWEASAVATWPVWRSLSVLGRLGLARGVLKGGGTVANKNESAYGPTYGIGGQMEFTHNLAGRVEYQVFSGQGGSQIPDTDIKILSLGALWRFR